MTMARWTAKGEVVSGLWWLCLLTFVWATTCPGREIVDLVPEESRGETTSSARIASGSQLPVSDHSVAAIVDLLFVAKEPGGDLRPCLQRAVGIKPDYGFKVKSSRELDRLREERSFEAAGSIGLVSRTQTNGLGGIRFMAVPATYQGDGYDLLVLGATYQVVVEVPCQQRAWLHVPKSLVPGKHYATKWVLSDIEAEATRGPVGLSIRGTLGGDLLEGKTDSMTAVYLDPETQKASDALVGDDGRFALWIDRLGGRLLLYDPHGDSVAVLCIVDAAGKSAVKLPAEADVVFDKTGFVVGRLQIPPALRPNREELFIGIYQDEESNVPLCFRRMASAQFVAPASNADRREGDLHRARAVRLSFVPGTYHARVYEDGPKLGVAPEPRYINPPRTLLSSMKIKFSADEKANEFVFPVGVTGGALPGQ